MEDDWGVARHDETESPTGHLHDPIAPAAPRACHDCDLQRHWMHTSMAWLLTVKTPMDNGTQWDLTQEHGDR